MEFGVLGPLRVVRGGQALTVASHRQRAVLAQLLLCANGAVPQSRLVEAVWGPRPAQSVDGLVRTYIWRLRTLLDEPDGGRISTEPGGYVLRVESGELDAEVFDTAVRRARATFARGDASAAAAGLRQALALWRGEPFADVVLHDEAARAEIGRLAEARLAALEERVEADLALGRHTDLIGELRQLAELHPLRERFAAQLMLAGYRAGRRAEALEAYRRTRVLLADELGVDPGAELKDLHERMLRSDSALLIGRSGWHGPRYAAPRQLPAPVGRLVGRDQELKALTRLLNDTPAGSTAAITSVDGTAGVGKTALAVYWAQHNSERFPDGQLYVDLRGFSPGGRPVTPEAALRGFLEAFAVPPDRIPPDLDARVALYRSVLAGRRVLVVLDNALDTDQVRPLLPGGRGCLTLVTSRTRLLGLVAAEGATPVTVDLLSAGDSLELLATRLGPERTGREPRAAAELVELCARLPLALGVAAARAAQEPDLPLAELAAQLRDARDRLDALDIGDRTTDPRAVFTWSYRALSGTAARVFRLLGLHPGPDVSVPATAGLAALPPAEAGRAVRELCDAGMLVEQAPGRFACHDLLRSFALERAQADEDEPGRGAAIDRVFDHYLQSAGAASPLAYPNRQYIALPPPRPGVVAEQPADAREALIWFATEYPVMLACVRLAAERRADADTCRLAWAVRTFGDQRGDWEALVAVQGAAVDAAERLADVEELARAHRSLGLYQGRLGDHQNAHTHLSRALDLYTSLGAAVDVAHTHHTLTIILERQGRHGDALGHAQSALELFRASGHRVGEALMLNAVGWYHTLLGDHEAALAHCRAAVELHRGLGHRAGEADAWDSLGHAHRELRRYQDAVSSYRHAVELRRSLGEQYSQASSLTRLARTHEAAGDDAAARQSWTQALEILDEIGHPEAESARARLRDLVSIPVRPIPVPTADRPRPSQGL